MGFAERNSLAGRTSHIAFPDAIKRDGSSNTATRLEVQITDTNGSPDDPDSSLIYVRVTSGTGTALDSLLYTNVDLAGGNAATNSTNGTYSNSGSAYWKMVATSNGKITLYHKTGTASNLEGAYNIEVAWFENGGAVATAKTFRVTDAADLDTMASTIDTINTNVSNVPTTAMRGTDSAALASVVGAVADAAATGASSGTNTAVAMLKGIIADTNELQGDDIPGSLTTLSTAVGAVQTAVNTVNSDLGNGTDGLGALKTLIDAVPTTAMRGTDSAALASVVGALNTGASATVNTTTPMMAYVKSILADTSELQADDIPGSLTTLSTAVGNIPTTAMRGTDSAATAAVVGALNTGASATVNTSTPMMAYVKSILGDTVALQTDWVDGGRLDLLLDAVKVVTDALPNSGALTDLATAANLTTLQSAVTSIQNNTRFVATVPVKLNRESAAVAVKCFLYDTDGNMEDADSNEVFVKISQMNGTAIGGRYFSNHDLAGGNAITVESSGTFSGYYPLSRTAAGLYSFFYKNDASHTEENLTVEFGWVEDSSVIYQSRSMQISDAADLDTMSTTLGTILADTNELQGDDIPGSLTTLSTAVGAVQTAVNTVNSDLSNGTDGLGALKTLIDAVPTTAMRGTDSAALASVLGAVNNAAASGASSGTDTAIAILKGIIADTNELQADNIPGSLTTLSTAVGNIPTTAMRGTDSAAAAAVVGALANNAVTTVSNSDTMMAYVKGILATSTGMATNTGTSLSAITTDTNELQTLFTTNGDHDGRLKKASRAVNWFTAKKYLKNDTAVMASDPSDDVINCANTNTTTSYVVLDVYAPFSAGESHWVYEDVFSVLKWNHQGTAAGSGAGVITTKWVVSAVSQTAGNAPASAVDITAEIAGTTTANTTSLSGLLNSTALAALNSGSAGPLYFALCGKVTTAGDTCTGKIYKSSSAEATVRTTYP